jgi:predicted PurR-regulated permease PerM
MKGDADMSKIKEMFSDWRYLKFCFYTIFTAALLYILYFIIKNIDVILVVAGSFLKNIFSALSPLFIGLFLAYLINPLVDVIDTRLMSKFFYKLPQDPFKQEKRLKTRRTVSILFSFLMVILSICLIIYAFAFLIVGQMTFNSLSNMLESIIAYFMQYEDIFRNLAARLPNSGLEEKLQELINDIATWIAEHISADTVIQFVTNIGGGILNIVLGIVVAIYLIKDKDFFIRLWRKSLHIFLPMKITAKINETLNDINTVFSRFLRGQLLDALIVAILSSVSLTIIGLDFAVLIGCFAGLTNIIPYFGPILGMIPAAIIGLLSEGFSQAVLAVVILLIIQQIDCNIISPKVVGSSTGLHPLFVLIAVTFGGYFWGIIGMLLAVPVAAYIKLFIVRKIKDKED